MYKLAPYYSANGQDFWVLRDKITNKVLNVAPTEFGLTWTTVNGKLVYYTNGKIKITPSFVYIVPKEGAELIKSDKVYSEKLNYSANVPTLILS